jgi:type I restriction enzyme M protein
MNVGSGTGRDPLDRYYTDPAVGRLFVDLLDRRQPSAILDLGSGGGSLSLAVARRWAGARILTVDVDHGSVESIRRGMASAGHELHEHLVADALDENLPELVSGARFDVAVCNPPYARTRWRTGFERILKEAGLCELQAIPRQALTSDILFVAQILRMAEAGAEIGIIIPDGLASGRRSRPIRSALLRRTCVTRIVQLPRGSFRGTDAQAHIVVLRNERGNGLEIEISRISASGPVAPLRISVADAEHRMDYSWYEPRLGGSGRTFTLRAIGAQILRGNLSSSEARSCPDPVFHTTDYRQPDSFAYSLSPSFSGADRPGCRVAEPGDILLARVDRELHRKACLVTEGRAVLTDCIFAIRVPAMWRHTVLRAFLSPRGQAALIRASRGVGARMLGKEDLLDLELETE